MPLITLTTDFGLSDPFVGLMKGVILSIAPGTQIVDLSHDVPPQDVVAGALVLDAAIGVFPGNSIHVAVIDPGVGTQRAAIALLTDTGTFIGPDNGLFTAVIARTTVRRAVRLTNTRYHRQTVSSTFHGRDIFAPVAAHLAAGVQSADLGEPVESLDDLYLIQLPYPREVGQTLEAHVMAIDRFGNLITDVPAEALQQWADHVEHRGLVFTINFTEIWGLSRTYADVQPGQPVVYIGSTGRVEIAVRNGSAAESLNAHRGSVVTITRV